MSSLATKFQHVETESSSGLLSAGELPPPPSLLIGVEEEDDADADADAGSWVIFMVAVAIAGRWLVVEEIQFTWIIWYIDTGRLLV
jgi:hypothetical protein